MLSAHEVKGREFPVAFVVGLAEGLFPAAGADLEEERRLFYVAFTRAKELVYLSYPNTFANEQIAPSHFLIDARLMLPSAARAMQDAFSNLSQVANLPLVNRSGGASGQVSQSTNAQSQAGLTNFAPDSNRTRGSQSLQEPFRQFAPGPHGDQTVSRQLSQQGTQNPTGPNRIAPAGPIPAAASANSSNGGVTPGMAMPGVAGQQMATQPLSQQAFKQQQLRQQPQPVLQPQMIHQKPQPMPQSQTMQQQSQPVPQQPRQIQGTQPQMPLAQQQANQQMPQSQTMQQQSQPVPQQPRQIQGTQPQMPLAQQQANQQMQQNAQQQPQQTGMVTVSSQGPKADPGFESRGRQLARPAQPAVPNSQSSNNAGSLPQSVGSQSASGGMSVSAGTTRATSFNTISSIDQSIAPSATPAPTNRVVKSVAGGPNTPEHYPSEPVSRGLPQRETAALNVSQLPSPEELRAKIAAEAAFIKSNEPDKKASETVRPVSMSPDLLPVPADKGQSSLLDGLFSASSNTASVPLGSVDADFPSTGPTQANDQLPSLIGKGSKPIVTSTTSTDSETAAMSGTSALAKLENTAVPPLLQASTPESAIVEVPESLVRGFQAALAQSALVQPEAGEPVEPMQQRIEQNLVDTGSHEDPLRQLGQDLQQAQPIGQHGQTIAAAVENQESLAQPRRWQSPWEKDQQTPVQQNNNRSIPATPPSVFDPPAAAMPTQGTADSLPNGDLNLNQFAEEHDYDAVPPSRVHGQNGADGSRMDAPYPVPGEIQSNSVPSSETDSDVADLLELAAKAPSRSQRRAKQRALQPLLLHQLLSKANPLKTR